jgi:hypothetical protein
VPTMFEVIVAYFDGDSWPVQLVEGETALRTAFQGDSGSWTCYAKARTEFEQFVFYSLCPVTVPEDKRPAAAEFITRANYGMIVGNFEMDYGDGEIRYKTAIDVEGTELTLPLCRQVVVPNVMMMDRYLPGLMAVVFGDVTPAQAIARIEKN